MIYLAGALVLIWFLSWVYSHYYISPQIKTFIEYSKLQQAQLQENILKQHQEALHALQMQREDTRDRSDTLPGRH